MFERFPDLISYWMMFSRAGIIVV